MWKRNELQLQSDKGPQYIHLTTDIPMEHDGHDIFLYCADMDERAKRLFREHHEEFQAVAEERCHRFRNPLVAGDIDTIDEAVIAIDGAMDVETERRGIGQVAALLRQYAIGEMPERPALLHYQMELTRRTFLQADLDGSTPYFVYSVYYLDNLARVPLKQDYLSDLMGAPSAGEWDEKEVLNRFIGDLKALLKLIGKILPA